ncbi:MAG: guanylate kinase [Gaiellaceae bacterium]|nr:guanylate kinase [Gaiellaceae bacterium]MDX6492839.1 guanylate kinase [Gaiellaceae bacterium]MDX6543418.1 guanylate kinase [Gaiellaceae bacterium]
MDSSTGKRLPVFVVTGPSGAGKGTLEKALLDRRHDLELAVSATTRERRPSEQDGREYWFLGREEFDRRVEAGDFLEWVPYVGHKYGTLRSEIDRISAAGRVPLLDLEIEGALNVRDTVPGAVTVFVDAPLDELERRLRERATESTGEIGERLELAREQKTRAGEFNYVVENRDLSRAVGELLAIVDRELATAGSMQA